MELPDYRDNLALVLEFFPNKRLLTMEDVRKFTGLKDTRAINRRYPMSHGEISAATFARALCSEKRK